MNIRVKWLIAFGIFLAVITVILWNSKIVCETWTGLNKYSLDMRYFLHYNFRSRGIIKPKIDNIELLDENYKQIPEENEYFDYEFLKSNEQDILLKIIFHKEMNRDFSPYMRVNYSIFGIKKTFLKKIKFSGNG